MDVTFSTDLSGQFPILSHVVVLLLPLLVLYAIWKRLIYPLFFSPLRHIPSAHPLASVSSAWINYIRYRSCENQTLLEAHKRLGEVIRLSPNEVSINCVDNGLRTVYAGGFEKPDWYPNLFTNYDGVELMFATKDSSGHSARKRMMSNVYAKSYIQSSPTMTLVLNRVIFERLLPVLQVKERMGAIVNIRRILESATMDGVTGYLFGSCNSSNFLRNPEEAEWMLSRYQSRKAHTFWPQEMPGLTNALSKIGIRLSPTWISDANHDLEAWCLQHCDDAENTLEQSEKVKSDDATVEENYPVVYAQLRGQLRKESQRPNAIPLSSAPPRLQIASEMLDHLSAGHETSGITLTFLFYELSRYPTLQRRLHAELQTLENPIAIPNGSAYMPTLPSTKTLDNLPLLHAVLMETLRRHPAIPGAQPRVTPVPKPNSHTQLGAYSNIPAGVRVSANAYCLHHNEQVFPDSFAFIPERWLDPFVHPTLAEDISSRRPAAQEPRKTPEEEAEVLKEMHRWFWAFSSGGRMCIGSNLAMLQMKVILASIVSCFKVELVSLDDRKMDESLYKGVWDDAVDEVHVKKPLKVPVLGQQDTYTAHPLAEKVNVRLRRWDEKPPSVYESESEG